MWNPREKIYVVEAPMGAFNNLSVRFHRRLLGPRRGRVFSGKYDLAESTTLFHDGGFSECVYSAYVCV